MRTKIVVLIVAALLIAPVAAHAIDFAAGLRIGSLEPGGKVQSGDGTKISLTGTLNLDEDSPVGVFVRVDGERHHFILDYTKITFDGSRGLTVPFTFDGTIYAINAVVNSELEFSLTELTYYYDLWETEIVPESKITLSPLVKVSIYDTSVDIDATANILGVPLALPLSESFSESLPLPSIGLICTYEFARIAKVSGQINAIGAGGNSFMEYEFIAGVKPIEFLNIELGYRTTQIDFDESGDALDFDMGGIFGQLSFVYSF